MTHSRLLLLALIIVGLVSLRILSPSTLHGAAQPALQAAWVQPGIIAITASQAGCIIAQPGRTLVLCDYRGGPWYVQIGAYADYAYSPMVSGRWYVLEGFSDNSQQYQTLGSVDVPPYAQVVMPLIAAP